MNPLAEIAQALSEHDLSADDENALRAEFFSRLDSWNEVADIQAVIQADHDSWLLPIDLIKAVFRRIQELNADDDGVVLWFASRLLFYGEPSDERAAQELLAKRGLKLP